MNILVGATVGAVAVALFSMFLLRFLRGIMVGEDFHRTPGDGTVLPISYWGWVTRMTFYGAVAGSLFGLTL